jgi:hypothetical protein
MPCVKTALTRHPGVQRRTDSNTYQFGLRTPRDLLSQFPGLWAVRCSLGTADLREANDKARALQAEWALRFEALRSREPVPADLSSLRAELLARIEAALPGIDERSAGLDAATRSERAEMVEWQLAEARDALSSGTVVDWGHEWLGRVVKQRSPAPDAEAMAALVLMLELHLKALRDSTRTFPLRVEKLNARRALCASASPTPAHGLAACARAATGRLPLAKLTAARSVPTSTPRTGPRTCSPSGSTRETLDSRHNADALPTTTPSRHRTSQPLLRRVAKPTTEAAMADALMRVIECTERGRCGRWR